jgi:glycoside/pentoside/hexuronide:cation symporter, GPH family
LNTVESQFTPNRATTLAFCAGAIASGVMSTVPSVLLLYYCTEIAGISAGWAAIILFLPKMLALVIDPAVGRVFDLSAGSQSARIAIMFAGTVMMAIAFKMTFTTPYPGAVAWTMGSYLLLSLGFSVYMVSHVAMPALYIDDHDVRSRWVGWRMTAAFFGILLGAGAAPLLVEQAGGGTVGYAAMSIILAPLCFVTACFAIWSLSKMPLKTTDVNHTQLAFGASFAHVVRAPLARALILGYLAMLTAIGVVTASLPYLIVKISGRSEGEVGTALGLLLIVGIVASPIWTRIGSRFPIIRGIIFASIGYATCIMIVGMAVALNAPWGLQLILFAAVGVPFAGLQVLPYTACAHMARAEAENGGPGEAMMAGIWTATEKLGLASGPAATALLIAVNGGVDARFAIIVSVATALMLGLSCILFAPIASSVSHNEK